MNIRDFYPEIESACHALNTLVIPILTEKAKLLGLTPQEADYLLAIPSFEPNPVSAATFRIRSPYTAESLYNARLNTSMMHGYLESAGVGAFYVNNAGMDVINALNLAIHESISSFQTLRTRELTDFAEHLRKLSDVCAWCAEPPGHWSIQHTRRLDPGISASLMVQVDQRLSELKAFRDDAHLASWRNLIEDGHAWDILTQLWAGEPRSAEELNTALSRRGNSLDQTKRALVLLIKKGWVYAKGIDVKITALGMNVRNSAEENTDLYFYTPFGTISTFELERTYELLLKHRREIPSV
jgi:hypothetical protein